MLCHALSLGAVHCLYSSCARRPGLCPGALICEIWFARLQVAALGSAASANRLHCYDTHTLDTPEHALGVNLDVVTQTFGCSLATSAEEGNSMISRKGVMNQ